MILCSAVAEQCMEGFRHSVYENHYDCMIAGHEESISKLNEISAKEVNKNKIFVKFICADETPKYRKS